MRIVASGFRARKAVTKGTDTISDTVGGIPIETWPRNGASASVPVKQTYPQLLFQHPNLPRQSGLRDAQAVGGLGQAAKFGDVQDGAQL